MTRHFTQAIVVAGLAALLGSIPVYAQDTRNTAEIPFAFHTADVWLTPGTYVVQRFNEAGLFRLYNFSGESTFVMMSIDKHRPADNARLTFRCNGDDCALAEIWTSDGMSYHRSKSSLEKEMHSRIDVAAEISVALKH